MQINEACVLKVIWYLNSMRMLCTFFEIYDIISNPGYILLFLYFTIIEIPKNTLIILDKIYDCKSEENYYSSQNMIYHSCASFF